MKARTERGEIIEGHLVAAPHDAGYFLAADGRVFDGTEVLILD